jgi:hypothetical protein
MNSNATGNPHSTANLGEHILSASRVFSFRSHEVARINQLITNQLDLMRSSFAFRFYEFCTWKNGSDERALRTFWTGVWGRGFRTARSRFSFARFADCCKFATTGSASSTGSNAVSPGASLRKCLPADAFTSGRLLAGHAPSRSSSLVT